MSATATAHTATVSNVGTIINSSNIQSLSFTDVGDGTVPGAAGVITIHYQKIGKLYFGFNAWLATSGQVNMLLGPLTASVNPASAGMNDIVTRVCTILGITENTRYVGYIYSSTPRVAAYNTGTLTWTQGNANDSSFLIGILAN